MSPNTKFTRHQAISDDARPDLRSLKGKSVVLTGGASGIGEQYMRSFVASGAFVTFSDIAIARGEALVNELGHDKVAFVPGNVLVWQDQLSLFKTALAKSPSKTIDIVVANAGIGMQDDCLHHTEDENGDPVEPELPILKVNIMGVFYTIKLAMFYLPKQPEGPDRDRCIILTASLSGYLDHKDAAQYSASKHAVRAIMKSLRQTGPEQNIRINVIAPWFIETRIMPQADWDRVKTMTGGEFADVEDAGRAATHLASDTRINGRALGIVPKSVLERGYFDLQKDDWNEDDYMSAYVEALRPSVMRTPCNRVEKSTASLEQRSEAAVPA